MAKVKNPERDFLLYDSGGFESFVGAVFIDCADAFC